MRVLMTSWAWPSHYLPMVPLGWALRAAGHEVRVASQPALAPTITDSGQVAVATGPDLVHADVHQKVMRDLRLTAVPHAPAPGATMRQWAPEARDRVRRVFAVFNEYADAMLDDLYEYAREWRPDLIVFDPTTFAAPLVGAALGIPTVRHIHGVDVTYQARDVIAELVAPLAARLGRSDVEPLGTATVDPCPPSMQSPANVVRIPTRYVPYNGRAVLPDWLRGPRHSDRPILCITWGTSTTRIAGFQLFAPPVVLSAVDGLDLDIVVTLTGPEADAFTDVPPGVRVVKGLPLHLVLPHCDAVVHQGGNGTILTAAYHGVPQLALPQLPDQTFHTRQFVTTGAGVSLLREDAAAPNIRAALTRLLNEPRYRAAADRLRAEMHAMPTPAEIVPDLTTLIARKELVS
jgi:UDP:flavonoid glycosyltransferase YjiC (YdhE family)